MVVTVQRKEIINLAERFQALNSYRGVKFAYAVSKNGDILKKEADSIKKGQFVPEFVEKVGKKRDELLYKNGMKNPDGSLIINGVQVSIDPNNLDQYRKELVELEKENKDLVESQRKNDMEYNEFLNQEVSLDLIELKLEDIPADITVEHFTYVSKFLEPMTK
jgi:hypothetical protein